MDRSIALNIFLAGALCGVLTTNACSSPTSGYNAFAQEGPVEVVIVDFQGTGDPMPVMICDGQEKSGVCAEVYLSNGGDNILHTR